MAQLPSIPKGTRDYSPEIMVKRNYIFDTIKSVFKLYGYMPLETPAMENLSTLMGKYGEEGDKLLFKILNSGDFIGNISDQELLEKNSIKLTNKISEKGLRTICRTTSKRINLSFQTLSNPAGLAGRSASERTLPGILSM